MSPSVRGLFKDRYSRDYVKFYREILKWKKSLVWFSEKNLYLMNKDSLLITLVKVSIVKLPRSGALLAAKQVDTSLSKKPSTPVFPPAHHEEKLILFEKTARCQVIITPTDGIVDSQVHRH